MHVRPRLAVVLSMFLLAVGCAKRNAPPAGPTSVADVAIPAPPKGAASLDEVLTSGVDLWGEAALKQPGGPSYDYFAKLLPPLRYVEAPFRVYPIALGAPAAAVKARLLGDGSMLNALGRQPNWRGETGIPVTFRVGARREIFGHDPRQLDGPKYADGYLPIVQTRYEHDGVTVAQEVFADVDAPNHGLALVRFTITDGAEGRVEAQLEGSNIYKAKDGVVHDDGGKVIACYDKNWTFNPARNTMRTELKSGAAATLAFFTRPGDAPFDVAAEYDARRAKCATTWNDLLAKGTTFEIPEPVINNGWRAAMIGNFILKTGDEARYSHGNQYAKLYIGEGGDFVRTMALFGHTEDAERMMTPLYVYTRKGLEYHQAGFKLQMLAHYWRLTRDDSFLRDNEKLWRKELNVILDGREKTSGMLPKEKYAGDIDTMIYSLNSNSNCWRALREMSVVLDGIGLSEESRKLAETAKEYRAVITKELDKVIDRSIDPPFVPLSLSGEEKPYAFIPEVRMGGYWNIMMQYVLGSGVFRVNSDVANDFLRYMQRRGGTVMGLLSTHGETTNYWLARRKINDLYGMRYALALLERDEPDRALISFYGKLAQGFTRDTFIGGEGSDIVPLDAFGRQMYLPPNSAGNANFLQQLRYVCVQDYDTDDDAQPDTLRLLFATPRRWLADGKAIKVNRAPTMFGEVSIAVESQLKDGTVTADLKLPERTPAKTFLRLRLPDGYRVTGAEANGQKLDVENGETINLAPVSGNVKLRATVSKG
jgi:hypothetical protein